jgi:RNA polymerase sigma factor (sigma-70 family)
MDSLQELFMELFLKRDKIKVGPENLKFYLLLALKRNLIKKMKAGRKLSRRSLETVDFEPEYSIEVHIMEQEKEKEMKMKIVHALSQLPSKQKEAVYLRFNESLDYPEIAEILEINIESVRKQVHRAIKTIREILGSEPFVTLFLLLKKKS